MTQPKPPMEEHKGQKNAFGGANPHGLYVPLTETEMEVLSRLLETDDLEVVIHGWGVLHQPRIQFGDLRISIAFRLDFNRPSAPMEVYFFDLELRTRAGLSLFRERQPTVYDGKPLQVCAGVFVDMIWDIALHHLDPKVVKTIKPGAKGLTSRRLDRDTGQATLTGNMKGLTFKQKGLLQYMRQTEEKLRQEDLRKLVKVTKASGQEVKVTDKGVEVPDVR